jgi:hypothetical protein
LEEGVLLARAQAAGQDFVDGGGVDLDGAPGDLPALIGQADDNGPAIIACRRALEQAAFDETSYEAAEGGLAEQDGFGQVVHPHLFASMEMEMQQDIEVADRQAAMPAQLGRQLSLNPVMCEPQGLPGRRAGVVVGLGLLVFGLSFFGFGFPFSVFGLPFSVFLISAGCIARG